MPQAGMEARKLAPKAVIAMSFYDVVLLEACWIGLTFFGFMDSKVALSACITVIALMGWTKLMRLTSL